MLLKLTKDVTINPEHVVLMTWDRGQYSYGPRDTTLHIKLSDGSSVDIVHNPYVLDGIDAYDVEAKILAVVSE